MFTTQKLDIGIFLFFGATGQKIIYVVHNNNPSHTNCLC